RMRTGSNNRGTAPKNQIPPNPLPYPLPDDSFPSSRYTRCFHGRTGVSQPVLAVVSVLGKDQKGVVAQFATYMAQRGINIEDIEQRVVRGFFLMDMLVDLKDLTSDLSELITGLLSLGKQMEMDVRVHLHSERRCKKVAILVSREPHCLEQLISDFQGGKLHGDIVAVLGNHPDLEPIAKNAKLPFAWKGHDDLESHFDW